MVQFINFRQNSDLISSSGAVSSDCVTQLGELNYQLVINLLPDDNEQALPNEKQLVESQQINYVYIPVDFKSPQEAEYQQFCEALAAHPNQKTHIHCASNYRASAFYAAYALENQIWNHTQAKQFISNLWQPKQHPQWQSFLARHHIP